VHDPIGWTVAGAHEVVTFARKTPSVSGCEIAGSNRRAAKMRLQQFCGKLSAHGMGSLLGSLTGFDDLLSITQRRRVQRTSFALLRFTDYKTTEGKLTCAGAISCFFVADIASMIFGEPSELASLCAKLQGRRRT